MLPSKAFWPARTGPNTVATVILAGTYSNQNDFKAMGPMKQFPSILTKEVPKLCYRICQCKEWSSWRYKVIGKSEI